MMKTVPETNKTSLGLYVTPQEAYAMWQADPEGVHFLDVRTFEEYIFVGHIEMARNIPLVYPKYDPPDDGAESALGVRTRKRRRLRPRFPH